MPFVPSALAQPVGINSANSCRHKSDDEGHHHQPSAQEHRCRNRSNHSNELDRALSVTQPEIFNTDQGSQYTSAVFTSRLKEANVRISMDGKGRAFDNIMIERLWRSVKYEEVYLKDYTSVHDCRRSLAAYFQFYNHERRHQSLDCRTPSDVYQAGV